MIAPGHIAGEPVARVIGVDDLPSLARGCALMGAGGGGDPLVGVLMAREAIAEHGPVALVDLDDLPPEGLVMPCGMVGAPTITVEKLQSGREGERLRDEVEWLTGCSVVAVMPFEIGGMNGVLPLTWAARLALPYVDADGMGRAFPMIPQMSMHVAGISSSPCVMADERDNVSIIRAPSVAWTERILRSTAAALGGAAVAAVYLMTVEEARRSAIRHSVSTALRLGATLANGGSHPTDDVLEATGAVTLISGKVVDVDRRTTGGFVRGSAIVQEAAADGRLLRLEIQNENLVALEDGRVRACVPDIITVLDANTGDAISTERLRFGQRVTVIAFECSAVWRTDAGLDIAGPRAFGYDLPYRPLERPRAA